MQQAQNQASVARTFSPSPVIVSPTGVPSSSAAIVALQISTNEQTVQSKPASITTAATALPNTTATAVQPPLVQFSGVRMVPVAPFVASQLRSSQSTATSSRPQQPVVQRPFIIGQPGLKLAQCSLDQ
jgi:hypothetical protein